ncbi:PREDICTED: transcription factor bHLH11 [Tarenaya hassleriana]|uniref:transcription factor bHLH11 n=1 Tax=Tarenaya hassleriana TaxID=28532 RepID=UPI00053C626C|nr:PREDICTED: transcription factor bHLH11 [Tarenaya hassleriana]
MIFCPLLLSSSSEFHYEIAENLPPLTKNTTNTDNSLISLVSVAMDQSMKKKARCSSESVTVDSSASSSRHDLRQGADASASKKDQFHSRKVQKADREKLRRDRLNEQFLELGNAIDPDRPKSDKASILSDTIQMLKDLMAEVNRLKAEYSNLSEESRELMQEKNELREEKASLKSDIISLNAQYQHRVRTMVPWAQPVDPSHVIHPSLYSYPFPVAITQGPISVHPPLQPFPFFGTQNPTVIPNPCSSLIPHSASDNASAPTEQGLVLHSLSSDSANRQDSKSKPLNHRKTNHSDNCDDHKDVALDLELKTPGSSTEQENKRNKKKEV